MKKLLTGALAVATLAVGTLGTADSAKALSLGTPCSIFSPNGPSIAKAVTPSFGCEIGTDNNDTVQKPLQVNVDQIFGFTDWRFLGKDEPGGTIDISPTFPSNTQNGNLSGTWNISPFTAPNWTDVMLVFKGGNGNPIRPEDYVSYLVRKAGAGTLSGIWTSPFFNINSGNSTAVSHISLYYREGPTAVPTPAAVLPALFGMGVAAVRKKKAASEVAQDA